VTTLELGLTLIIIRAITQVIKADGFHTCVSVR